MTEITATLDEWGNLTVPLELSDVRTILLDGERALMYDLRNTPDADGARVLRDIDQLRRDLSGYHDRLKAHNGLQRHCDNQRRRINELEGLYAEAKADNEKFKELVRELWHLVNHRSGYGYAAALEHIEELGIEVGE